MDANSVIVFFDILNHMKRTHDLRFQRHSLSFPGAAHARDLLLLLLERKLTSFQWGERYFTSLFFTFIPMHNEYLFHFSQYAIY